MRLAFAFAVVFSAFTLLACERRAVPPLVEVTEIAPRSVEGGDRLDIRGEGFPQGRPARVTLSGRLARAGEPETSVAIDAEATVVTNERIELVVREALEEKLCGRGDRAAHATFSGDVDVAFASRAPGAPPLVGTMRAVTLDFRPASVRAAVVQARAEEGRRVLEFLGLRVGAPTPRGLPIDEVAGGSPAWRAGLRPGDVLVAVDGVNSLGVEDVLPSSSRTTRLSILRVEGGAEEALEVPLTGFAGRRFPRELEPALLIVAVALAALLLLILPGPALLTRLELFLSSRLRVRQEKKVVSLLVGPRVEACASVLVSAVLATFALTPSVLGPDFDGIFMLVAAVTSLLAARVGAARGLAEKASVGSGVLASLLVGVLAIAVQAAAVGAVELAELVRVQGATPWRFAAAQKPSALVLACAFCAAIVGAVRLRPGDGTVASVHARVLERAGLLSASGLAAATFLGGWQLPGLEEPRGTALRALAALVFVAKTWILAAAIEGASGLLGGHRAGDARRFALTRGTPMLLLGGALAVATRRLSPSAAVEEAIGAASFAAVVLVAIRTVVRVRGALARREPRASPFL